MGYWWGFLGNYTGWDLLHLFINLFRLISKNNLFIFSERFGVLPRYICRSKKKTLTRAKKTKPKLIEY